MKRSLEEKLSEVYISNMDIIGEGLPAAVNAARRGFLESFNLLSLPDAGDERYRHCDMRRLFDAEWEYYFTPQAAAEAEKLPVDGYNIDVTNGFCGDGDFLVELNDGIVYGSLKAALSREDVALKYYNSLADNDGEAVTALNSLFMQDGAFVYVPAGVRAEKPFVLTFGYDSQEQEQMCFGRTLIVAEQGAQADIVISHRTKSDSRFLVDFVREAVAADGARLSITEISRVNDKSALISGSYMSQGGDSRTRLLNVWFEGGVTRVNGNADLVGRGGDMTHNALYFGRGAERTDINLNVSHLVPDCTSSQLIKGVVAGSAVGAFTGRVLVAQDAQRTAAFQQSRNLQLSADAKIYTEPQLEIYADDVKCSHGATVGQMNEDAIYYMRQRGIDEKDARKLQLFGFVNDIVAHCTDESVCGFVRELAEARISEM